MKSIKDIYKIGKGPSSSHTMGPAAAMEIFVRENPDVDHYEVTLFGSLADTGEGHGTDKAITAVAAAVGKDVNITRRPRPSSRKHPRYICRKGWYRYEQNACYERWRRRYRDRGKTLLPAS